MEEMNTEKKKEEELEEEEIQISPPGYGVDGKWGWFVVFNSFICNMIVDGVQYTFANFLVPIAMGLIISTAQTSLIGSLLSGFYNFSGPLAGALGNKFGFRMVIITGSLISGSGLMLSYFASCVEYLYFFYGVLGGLGFGMIYMASVITTSLYFEKYRALAASLSVCGTGVGTFVFAPLGDLLVTTWGWRYALVTEGGIVLVCILCGLSFKPLEFVTVVPVSREPSEVSSGASESTGRRGSVYYPTETKKALPNEAYPTFKEALLEGVQEERRSTITSISMNYAARRSNKGSEVESTATLRRAPIYSIMGSLQRIAEEEPTTRKRKINRCCRICCFNFWHCRCKHRDLTLGDRPLYRDDIFYGGSLTSLRAYSTNESINYHLSVTRVPNAQELEQHAARKCCVCHQAVLRTWVTMMGFNLFKSKVFVFLCISSFLYTMSLYIPFVYVRQLAKGSIADDQAVWLVSALGISNTAGRLISGLIKSFVPVNAAILCLSCLLVSGVISFIFIIKVNLITLFSFSCAFGLFTAPFISLRPVIIVEFLGLEKLTNAFGLVLLSQGIASIIGPPIAGVIQESSGHYDFVMYLSGGLMILSALSLLASVLLNMYVRGKG